MATTKLSERGQVVIPKPIRDSLGLRRGQEFDVELANGIIQMRPRAPARSRTKKKDWRRWRGVLAGTGALQDLEAEHRHEIESGR